MRGLLQALLLCLAPFSLTAFAATAEQAALMRPLGSPGRYTFSPNQLAAAAWYMPAGRLVNGHIEESFGNEKNWSELHRFLEKTDGAFGVNGAEIGYLTSDWLLKLRRAGIRLSVETSAWPQCSRGVELARAEFFGDPVAGRNLFQSIFHVEIADGRSDPAGHGWFFTKDRKDYAPDEIVLDHRILQLLPRFDNDVLLKASPKLSWQARKDMARRDPCPAADGFHNPSVDRLTGALRDYVDYMSVMAQKFPARPAFSFHWNVNPGWEWGDEQCLDRLHERYPDEASFDKAFRYLERPCHRDEAILDHLVDTLCKAGTCPATVFMDIDLHYRTNYALDALRRDRAVLRKYGVSFGVDLADECNEQPNCVEVETAPQEMQLEQKISTDTQSENILNQDSLVNKFKFLVDNGIINRNTHVRFESWSVRPIEQGDAVSERNETSYANTVRGLIQKFIYSHRWVDPPAPN
jgi:hypothetical protein